MAIVTAHTAGSFLKEDWLDPSSIRVEVKRLSRLLLLFSVRSQRGQSTDSGKQTTADGNEQAYWSHKFETFHAEDALPISIT
jgi:hypothetical protein